MKKCPFCAEEIQSEAKKCKHCGEFLAEGVKTQETKKAENRSGIGDFTRCKIIKDGPANIRCPKCGFHGLTKEIKGDYNPIIFWILFLCFPMIGGILYYLFATKNEYVCPECDGNYLEVLSQPENEEKRVKNTEISGKRIGLLFLICFLGLLLILILGRR